MDVSPARERERSTTPPPKLPSVVISMNNSKPIVAPSQSKTSVFDRIGAKKRIPKIGKTEQKRRIYKQALRNANEPSKNGIPSLFSSRPKKLVHNQQIQQKIPSLLSLNLQPVKPEPRIGQNPKKRPNPR